MGTEIKVLQPDGTQRALIIESGRWADSGEIVGDPRLAGVFSPMCDECGDTTCPRVMMAFNYVIPVVGCTHRFKEKTNGR